MRRTWGRLTGVEKFSLLLLGVLTFGAIVIPWFARDPLAIADVVGSRLIGPGNTDGDVAVYVPKERVLATGDLLVHPIPYSFNAHPESWARVLARLAGLDAAAIVPGHGPVFRDKEYLLAVKALLESVAAQARAAKQRGLSVEEAQRAVDLESFRKRFAGDDPSRNDAWTGYFLNPAVASVYAELGP